MARYIHRPYYVDAVQWTGENIQDMELLASGFKTSHNNDTFYIEVPEYMIIVNLKEFVVRDHEKIFVLPEDHFVNNFDQVVEEDQ